MAKIDFTWTDDDRGLIVDLEVNGTIVPYSDSDHDGGYVEDVEFNVIDFRIKIGKRYYEIEVDDDMASHLENLLEEKYENDRQFQEIVDQQFADYGLFY